MSNSRTPLGPTNRKVLAHLEECVEARDDDVALTHEAAIDCLTDGEFEYTEATQQIEQLLLKGYLYEVEDEIRVPPRPYDS